jgi:hypothetical protein
MDADAEFLFDDRQTLDAMLEIYSRRSGSCLTLGCLLDRWATLVDQLGGEARPSRDEYEAELCVRGLLEELVECLSEPGRQVLLRALVGPDRRFLAQTIVRSDQPARMWWQRIPPAWAGVQLNHKARDGSPELQTNLPPSVSGARSSPVP